MTDVSVGYILADANTGNNIIPLPFTPTGPASRLINGCGSFPGTVPLYHPATITENLQGLPAGVREINAVRNGSVIWNGPLETIGPANLRTNPPTLPLVFREASWWLKKRALEMDKHYNADLFYIVRDLIFYMLNKQSNGLTSGGTSINASLPRFAVSPASGNSGTTKHIGFPGVDRLMIGDILDDLAADPTTGLDYKMVYTNIGTTGQCQRTLTIGSPSLGTSININLNEHVLWDFSKQSELDRAGTRAHVIGNAYTDTEQNTGSVTAGTPLLDVVFNRTDTSVVATIQAFAKDARRRVQPPIAPVTFSWRPTDANGPFPWGWCDVGDKVPLSVAAQDSMLYSGGSQRIIQLDWYPPSVSAPESMTGTLNLPLDQLGT